MRQAHGRLDSVWQSIDLMGQATSSSGLRILITTQSVQGYQNYVRFMHFGRRLAARGHQVTLATASWNRTPVRRVEMVDGVRVIVGASLGTWRMRRGGLEPLDILGRIGNALTEEYDIVHCDGHRPAGVLQTLAARALHRTPWVSEWVDLFGGHGIAQGRSGMGRLVASTLETRLEEEVRRRAPAVIAISRGLYEHARSIGVPEDRLVYIPGGADVQRFGSATQREAREKLGISADIPIVGLAGYETADRADAELVLRACVALRRKYPGLKLVVTGKVDLDPTTVQALGVGDLLLLPGWVSEEDYPLWLSIVDLFALPFCNTGRNASKWPMKAGDYLGVGRPIVTNPTGDLKPLFAEYEIGMLVEETALGFERGLDAFLGDPELAARVGRNAQGVAKGPLSWDNMTDRLEATYESVLGLRPWQLPAFDNLGPEP